MLIKRIAKRDTPQVSQIHRDILKTGVISHMGISFLEKFYEILLEQKNIATFVAYEDNKVVAFATAAFDLKSIPRLIIQNLWQEILISLFKNPFLLYKLIQMPFYPSFKEHGQIGEIFSIAVLPQYQRSGIGTNLIMRCQKEFKRYKCKLFQLSVRKKIKSANNFYVKIGLKKKSQGKFLGEDIIFYQGKV